MHVLSVSLSWFLDLNLVLFYQRRNCGFSQSAQAVDPMDKLVQVHVHFTLLFLLIAICLFLVEDWVAAGTVVSTKFSV